MNRFVDILRPALVIAVACLISASSNAQPPRVYRDRVEPNWFHQGTKFWYRLDLKDGKREFVVVDAVAGTRLPAFDHKAVADKMSAELQQPVDSAMLPVQTLEFAEDGDSVLLIGPRGKFRIDLATQTISLEAADGGGDSGARLFLPPGPSVGRGGDTEIVVTNSLDRPIDLIWINTSGHRQSYGIVPPGQTRRQHTFVGHIWLLAYVADSVEDAEPIGCLQGQEASVELNLNATAIANVERRSGRFGRQRRNGSASSGAAAATSPDGSLEAFVRDDNLWFRLKSDGSERAVTTDATAASTFRQDRSRRRLVGMAYDLQDAPVDQADVQWSPDSRFVIAMQTVTVPERRVYYVESSPQDGLQPELQSYPYLKAGDPIPVSWPRLFSVPQGTEISVSRELFPNPWDLQFLRFSEDGQRCFWLYNERGHQVLRVLELTLATGQVRAVVDEHSDTFIHYSSGGKFEMRWLPDQQLLWASERSGWNHLYRYNAAANTDEGSVLINAVTSGDWNVRKIETIDEVSGTIWFYAVGIAADQDPYHEHFCRVNLDGTELKVLTSGDGTHQIAWSPDKAYFIDRYSRVDLPPITELRSSSDGSLICHLETADASEVLAARGTLPERFVAKGRDGKTDIWGIIHRPKNFDPGQRYAVVENIYAGPHDHHVPKAFRTAWNHQHRIADAGHIVVQIDGMGTAWRSKAFHDVCFQNLKDAGFPDRIRWMQSAAEKYPQLDVSRVGIYGGSAGGQNAMAALLWHGDFYKAAVADCGCHDNRMDKIWWNEQWMGYPVGDHYAANSNMQHAAQLQGQLMLVVGELDRNVDPATTTQVVGSLIRANKDFDFLLVVGAGHGACETPWASEQRLKFFQTHLAAAEEAK